MRFRRCPKSVFFVIFLLELYSCSRSWKYIIQFSRSFNIGQWNDLSRNKNQEKLRNSEGYELDEGRQNLITVKFVNKERQQTYKHWRKKQTIFFKRKISALYYIIKERFGKYLFVQIIHRKKKKKLLLYFVPEFF